MSRHGADAGNRYSHGRRRQTAHILLPFLVEAVILSATGGILGVLTGIVGARLLTTVAGWPTIILPTAMAIAFVFSLSVGIFFGLYLAEKASRLNPIEALRYE